MALSRTLDVDVEALRQQASASDAAAAAAAGVQAVPFHPAPAAEGFPEAAAAAEAAAVAAEGASPPVSSEELNSSDTEAGTEAAVAPYMARLSPSPTLQPLQAADEPPAPGAVAAGAPSRAAPLSAADDDQPPSPVTRAAARRRHQRQQEQQQQQQMQGALQIQRREEAALEQQASLQQPGRQERAPAVLPAERPPADQAAAPEVRHNTSGPSSPPAKAKVPLVPWSKAAATAAERQIYESGTMSATTLRFISPQREAEFGAAHAAFLTRWVCSPVPTDPAASPAVSQHHLYIT
jgi:hypothetical protein